MKPFLISFILIFSASSVFAQQAGVNAASTSEDIYACNLSLNAVPTDNPVGKIMGSLIWEDLTVSENSINRTRSGGYVLSDETSAIFDSSGQWNAAINNLKLSFSTEQMGVGYNVHVCYVGPTEKKNGRNDQSEQVYTIANSVYHSLQDYAKFAQLYYRTITRCDLRGLGSQSSARPKNQRRPSGEMEVDYTYASNWAAFDGSYKETIAVLNSNRPKNTPRFCEVIFQFKEGSTEARPNDLKYTEVNLGVDVY
ncbi:MAG: hypothetical protein OM95_00560 [Bdellovibrio sp. ArHS]|uniref:hypothetical protein n=1 Tax=Bdellovibrio sp. ArHS TaxID=1569284 RepID=UPI000582FD7A|nr:hypothetical protein [Bdellovibrio sp. ArHS]KHD90046.1 MAG: hypothetical protein OM95_00560 [Bdellovibrio sp. ArHS]